jgi:hypothetical protein
MGNNRSETPYLTKQQLKEILLAEKELEDRWHLHPLSYPHVEYVKVRDLQQIHANKNPKKEP